MEGTDRELRALVLDNARLINRIRRTCGLAEVDFVPTEALLDARPERNVT